MRINKSLHTWQTLPFKSRGNRENMVRICKFVDERFQTYRNQLVKQSESTVMVLAALSIAEELFEAREHNSDSSIDDAILEK